MERKRYTNTNKVIKKANPYGNVNFFFMLSIFTMIFSDAIGSTMACLDARRCPVFAKADTDSKRFEERIGQGIIFEGKKRLSQGWARRFLGGPGSSPPRCTSKCGNCTPCRPVHVPVPLGTSVTAEYYPEAWRCMCGNKLNMP